MKKNHVAKFREYAKIGFVPEEHLIGIIQENRSVQVRNSLSYLGLTLEKDGIHENGTNKMLKEINDETFVKENGDIVHIVIESDPSGIMFKSYIERNGIKKVELSINYYDDYEDLRRVNCSVDISDLHSVGDKVDNYPNFEATQCYISFEEKSIGCTVNGEKDNSYYSRHMSISGGAIDLEQGSVEKGSSVPEAKTSKRLFYIPGHKTMDFIDGGELSPIDLSNPKSTGKYLVQSLFLNQKTKNDLTFIKECFAVEYPALGEFISNLITNFAKSKASSLNYDGDVPDKRIIDEAVDTVFNSYAYDDESEKHS